MEQIKLTIIKGPAEKSSFTINDDEDLIVGRGADSNTKTADPALSRKHFQISLTVGQIILKDVGSSSGTFVNGERINSPTMLDLSDEIRAGDSIFKVSAPGVEPVKEKRPTSITDMIGHKLGSIRIDSVIVKGQNGVVFKGVDQAKNRVAAVKVLLPQVAKDEEQRERFVRAMKTMLNVKDTHIIELYSAGRTGLFCWYAMEYVEGESLHSLIERLGVDGKLLWEEVWRAAVHITRALQVGYRRDIIHRNVTPKNIMRRQHDKVCKLGDFMFAKALDGALAFDVTSPGQLLGDLHYMPPERVGVDAKIDTQSDMYGLGATCYALLTGQPPVTGKAMVQIISSIRDEVPALPSTFQPEVNSEFEAVIMKMLEKKPDDRFYSPDQLLKALEQVGKANNLDTDFSDWWAG